MKGILFARLMNHQDDASQARSQPTRGQKIFHFPFQIFHSPFAIAGIHVA